ncbi:hypothetical protein BP5796_09039 [Coleophoma crateriformis]|uniref:non-specific serine/threonine protein kinase n=1 Tax=Coleophoma crateriformis TaxID=565419 RepID=A0A3D8R2V4_9HELO|nr:hypothetical protein BP5796_09039 [Coleophoma crateriformis]
MDYRRPSLVKNAEELRKTQRSSHTYISFTGADNCVRNTNGYSLDTSNIMWWDEKIHATVNRQFVASKLRPDEQLRLDRPVGFGGGLTDDTYMDWIEEKAKRFFLILVDLGVPDQIFGVIDDSWDDEDLPVPFNQVERLQLTYDKDEKVERRFFQRQFLYLLRAIQKGDHNFYDDIEVVPLELADKVPGANLLNKNIDKVHLPGKPDEVLLRRRIQIGDAAGQMSRADFLHVVDTMKAVDHDHLLSLWASYEHEGYGYLLLTPVYDTTFKSFLLVTPPSFKILPKTDRRSLLLNWLYCLADALAFLHGKGRAHLHIKPSNVLLDADNQIFLGDTGVFSAFSSGGEKKGFDQETYNYGPPEHVGHPAVPQPTSSRPSTRRSGPPFNLSSPSSPILSTDNPSMLTSSTGSTDPGSKRAKNTGKHDPQKFDIFSLGTIFLEIITFLMKRASRNFASHRSSKNKTPGRGGGLPDSSFHKNLGQVEKWMEILAKDASKKEDKLFRGVKDILGLCARMLSVDPAGRPTAAEVSEQLRTILTTGCGLEARKIHCMERKIDANQWNFGFEELRLASQRAAAEACAIAAATDVPVMASTPPVITPGVSPYDTFAFQSPIYQLDSKLSRNGSLVTQGTRPTSRGGTEGNNSSRSSSGKETVKAKPKAKAWRAPVYAGE